MYAGLVNAQALSLGAESDGAGAAALDKQDGDVGTLDREKSRTKSEHGAAVGDKNDRDKLMSGGNFWSVVWLILAIGVDVSYFGCFFFSTRLASIIRNKYEKIYFEAIVFQKTSFFDDEDHSQGSMTSRASGDPKQLEELMGANMASVYVAIFSLTGAIANAFPFGWKLALVASCVMLQTVIGSSYWRFNKMNDEVFAESSDDMSLS